MPIAEDKQNSVQKYLIAYFAFAFLGALGELIFLLSISADPKNSVLFGYSISRLALAGFFLVAMICSIAFAFKSWRNQLWTQRVDHRIFSNAMRSSWGLRISGAVFIISGLLILFPFFQHPSLAAYAERLRPFLIYIAQISFQTTILILHRQQRLHWSLLKREIQKSRVTFWIGGICLVVFGALWLVIAQTGIGVEVSPDTDWYETGVPILGLQVVLAGVIAALVVGVLAWGSRKLRYFQDKPAIWLDIVLGVSIWALTAFLWTQAPQTANFYSPGPFPPSETYFPYSDAATFDKYAQLALAGKGLAGGQVFKGHFAYIGFLTLLHLIAGQDYGYLVALQVCVFAVFPVIVYYLGKALHSRFLGLFLAGVMILRELNAFASSQFLTLSHARLLLSEFPTRIGLALLVLLLFTWLRKTRPTIAQALPVGGVIGILILLRYNNLSLPLAVIVGLMVVFGREWKKWLPATLGLIVAVGITLSPWMWRSWMLSGNPIFFAPKVAYRFSVEYQPTPESSINPPRLAPTLETEPGSPPHADISVPGVTPKVAYPPIVTAQPAKPAKATAKSPVYRVGSYFIHNLLTSFLILPTRPIFEFNPAAIADGSLYQSVSFWQGIHSGWLENLPGVDVLGIAVNLLILAIGIGAAGRQWRWAGLIPMGVFLAYHLSTAIILDGGGRDIVPVDWIVLIYFGIGGLQLVQWGAAGLGFNLRFRQPVVGKPWSLRTGILGLLPFTLFVLGMLWLDRGSPPQYPYLSKTEVLDILLQEELLEQTDFDAASLEKFLNQPETRAIRGLNLYPRYFGRNQGLHEGVYVHQPYPRLALTILSAWGIDSVILPLNQSPVNFQNGVDVVVIGCPASYGSVAYLDALLIANLGNPPTIYTRTLTFPLSCWPPLPVGEGGG